MTMARLLGKLVVYALLIGGALIFLTPLLWMMATALKPIEQTMSMPPSWVPYRYHAQVDGREVPVKKGESYVEPRVVILRDGERVIVEPRNVIAETDQVLQTIEASGAHPWLRVRPERPEDGDWVVVPREELRREVAPRWGNFSAAMVAMKHVPRYLKNTLVLCFLTVVGTVFSSALAAYGFSRIPWPGRNRVFIIALATMMIPFPVVMVPLYSLFKTLGWIGTLKPLWVGSFFAGAFNVFLLRQFFMTLPKDLSDAARIDGCGEFRIFWQIMLPLSRPALMVVGLFQFMYTWNDFMGPLIYLTDQKDFTLALGLQFFQSQQGGTEWHYLMAASSLVVLPVIVLFFLAQRTFIEGISMTGLKG